MPTIESLKTPEKDSGKAKCTDIPMTPNTCKRKSCLADDLANYMKELELTSRKDQLEVIALLLKKLGLHEKSKLEQKPTKAGCKLTLIETKQQVWDFWHSNSTRSTITSCPAKIKICDKPKIQIYLAFVDSVNIIKGCVCFIFASLFCMSKSEHL